MKATTNSAGFQSPTPFTAILFEEGGVLTAHQVVVNGELLFTRAVNGAQRNNVTEVTCSFTIGAGDDFVITGILAAA